VKLRIVGVLAAAAVGLAACGGGASASSNDKGSVADMCYITLAGEVTEYASVMLAKGQSCSTIAFARQQEFYGATVSSDGSAKPWPSGYSAACEGVLTSASDPSFVIAQGGDDSGGVCSTLGFTEMP
jgi:hypothetical protein